MNQKMERKSKNLSSSNKIKKRFFKHLTKVGKVIVFAAFYSSTYVPLASARDKVQVIGGIEKNATVATKLKTVSEFLTDKKKLGGSVNYSLSAIVILYLMGVESNLTFGLASFPAILIWCYRIADFIKGK